MGTDVGLLPDRPPCSGSRGNLWPLEGSFPGSHFRARDVPVPVPPGNAGASPAIRHRATSLP